MTEISEITESKKSNARIITALSIAALLILLSIAFIPPFLATNQQIQLPNPMYNTIGKSIPADRLQALPLFNPTDEEQTTCISNGTLKVAGSFNNTPNQDGSDITLLHIQKDATEATCQPDAVIILPTAVVAAILEEQRILKMATENYQAKQKEAEAFFQSAQKAAIEATNTVIAATQKVSAAQEQSQQPTPQAETGKIEGFNLNAQGDPTTEQPTTEPEAEQEQPEPEPKN